MRCAWAGTEVVGRREVVDMQTAGEEIVAYKLVGSICFRRLRV